MRFLHTSLVIGLALSVSACGTKNRGLESVHQPVVSRTNYALDLNASASGLSASDTNRLQTWFDSLKLGYGDHIAVDTADGSTNGADRDAIAGVAARYGLLLDNNAPVTEGEVTIGTIRVVVSRSKATVPGCPDWSRTSEINFNEHNGSNFGCGVNSNLAAMVANPEDLVLGQTADSSVDAATSGKAIKSYRSKKATGDDPLKNESSRSN
jgi:pilus assembly protein CpaD